MYLLTFTDLSTAEDDIMLTYGLVSRLPTILPVAGAHRRICLITGHLLDIYLFHFLKNNKGIHWDFNLNTMMPGREEVHESDEWLSSSPLGP